MSNFNCIYIFQSSLFSFSVVSKIREKIIFSVLKWNILCCFVLVEGGRNKLLNWIINCGEVLQSESPAVENEETAEEKGISLDVLEL